MYISLVLPRVSRAKLTRTRSSMIRLSTLDSYSSSSSAALREGSSGQQAGVVEVIAQMQKDRWCHFRYSDGERQPWNAV